MAETISILHNRCLRTSQTTIWKLFSCNFNHYDWTIYHYYLNATTGQYHSYWLLLFILIMYGHFSFPFVILFFKSTFYTAELPVSILCSQSLPFLIPFSCINGFCSPSKSFLPGVTWPSILKQLLVINIFMFTLFTQLTLISALQDRLSWSTARCCCVPHLHATNVIRSWSLTPK